MNASSKSKKEPSKPPAGEPKGETDSECQRCGTCCKKGGPSFHHADKDLIDKGVIHTRCLYTIRKGELAYDNVRQCLEAASSDIIKIKGKGDSLICMFFDEAQNACTIYENRPTECRALKCWDTAELEKMYARKRLSREDLLGKIEGLWDLIKAHQERCNYAVIHELVKAINQKRGGNARQKLAERIQYDEEIRRLVVSRAGLETEMLDFLFGRPLNETVKKLGLKVLPKES